ncbi:baseplate wedge subunit [Acinetobacter phage SH-Ab 15599]|nr:baseplate wedge subunit [Acinetobacter phage SH-Ab 15599]
MSNRQPDSFDFRDIQESLQQFLSTDPRFQDVNWKGSVAARMIDLHAYNTSINASSVGFAFNEGSLHSATIRENAAAKASGVLNYLPASKRCSELYVKLEVSPSTVNPDSEIAFDREVRFVGVSNQVTLNFVPDTTYKAQLEDGLYTFPSVRLIQGERVTNRFIVNTAQSIETYIIPNQNIDINTLNVMVKEGDTLMPYTRYKHPNQLGKNNRLFYLRINPMGQYTIEFGDNVFSRQLEYAETVVIDYVSTKGDEGNGAAKVAPSGAIGGSTNIAVTMLSQYSTGGADEESIESIKRLAPLGFGSNGACVTDADFISATKEIMGDSISVNAWGGEQNDPPKYGYTFISVRGKDGNAIDQYTKDYLKEQLQPLCVGQITPVIRDAAITYLYTDVKFDYNENRTVLTKSQLERKVEEALIAYSKRNLEQFSQDFDNSVLNAYVKSIDNSITIGQTNIAFYQYNDQAEANYYFSGKQSFDFPIVDGSVVVSGFKPLETDNNLYNYELYESNKQLLMRRINIANGSISLYPGKYGSVDHANGVVNIQNLYIDELSPRLKVFVQKDALDKSAKAEKDVIFQIDVGTVTGAKL